MEEECRALLKRFFKERRDQRKAAKKQRQAAGECAASEVNGSATVTANGPAVAADGTVGVEAERAAQRAASTEPAAFQANE